MKTATHQVDVQLSAPLLLLLAMACGLAVAALYYSHPLLPLFAQSLSVSAQQIGALPTLTQAGYALGLLLLVPLGDKFDRRKVIVVKGIALAVALAATAVSQGLTLLLGASLIVGITASMAQDIIPTAAHLAPASERGRVVGLVMTGLLSGILLSRVLSGLLGEVVGWRGVYWTAAAAILLLTLCLWRVLPVITPQSQLSTTEVYRSMWRLLKDQPAIQKAALAQGLLNAGFSAFWTTLSLMLSQQFHLGSSIAGLFGLAGAAGALAAPAVGKLADKFGSNKLARVGALLVSVSFLVLLVPVTSLAMPAYMALLAIMTVTFDLGVQIALISHQTIIYNTVPTAMARGNALLLVGVFIGMTAGSYCASQLFAAFGWQAVMGFALLAALGALVLRCIPESRSDNVLVIGK